jgi:threonine dehydrogenase-like Zn-dependent dehydrogenase
MLALNYDPRVRRLAATKLLGSVRADMYLGPTSPLQLEEVPDPTLLRDDWVILRVRLCGICGSDYKQIFMTGGSTENPMTALISFPHVLGHEIVGEVVEAGPRSGRQAGERILVNPWLSCGPRGIDPPCVALHAIWSNPPGDSALVYGCGTLGQLAVAILKHRYPTTRVLAVARFAHQRTLAEQLGADLVLDSEDAEEIIKRTVVDLGGEILTPWRGLPWSMDGVSVVYDTVGFPETIEIGLRLVRARGRIVVLGVEAPRRFEWTPLYFKEVAVVGSNAFSVETDPVEGHRKHAMEHYFDFVAEGFDATSIITHRMPLAAYREAFTACHDQAQHGAIKVVFEQ